MVNRFASGISNNQLIKQNNFWIFLGKGSIYLIVIWISFLTTDEKDKNYPY